MLFSSYTFLFAFLPAVIAVYFLLPLGFPHRMRLGVQNAVLLVFSLLFYAWGEPIYIFLMLGTILVNYLFGRMLPHTAHKRLALVAAVAFDLALLFFFKYAGFFAGLLGIRFPEVRLPLGISFYTFQALSYVLDVYREDAKSEKSLSRFGTYVTLFPQLVAGPIVRYLDVAEDLTARAHSVSRAAEGSARFAAGLAKKVLIANAAGELFASLTKSPSVGLVGAWLSLVAFAFQIYFDFSGYSDMAIGLGEIFGFRFPENFNYPYTASSFSDFWRRWHITLSSFFRSYVYFPLGGNRRGTLRTICNLFVVWSLTGLWHGAAPNFLLWGIYWFVLLATEKFLFGKRMEKAPLALRRAITLLGILGGWLIFAFDGSTPALSLAAFLKFLPALVGKNGLFRGRELYELTRYLPLLLLAAIGATPLPRRLYHRVTDREKGSFLSFLLPVLGIFLSVAYLAEAGFNPFLYFRF